MEENEYREKPAAICRLPGCTVYISGGGYDGKPEEELERARGEARRAARGILSRAGPEAGAPPADETPQLRQEST